MVLWLTLDRRLCQTFVANAYSRLLETIAKSGASLIVARESGRGACDPRVNTIRGIVKVAASMRRASAIVEACYRTLLSQEAHVISDESAVAREEAHDLAKPRSLVEKENTTIITAPARRRTSRGALKHSPADRGGDLRLRQGKLQERVAKLSGGVA